MRLSLHMLVLNGAAVLDRALRPLAGVVAMQQISMSTIPSLFTMR